MFFFYVTAHTFIDNFSAFLELFPSTITQVTSKHFIRINPLGFVAVVELIIVYINVQERYPEFYFVVTVLFLTISFHCIPT